MEVIRIYVGGEPQMQGSKTQGITKTGKRYFREAGGEKLYSWRNVVKGTALETVGHGCAEYLVGPVTLGLVFFLTRAKGHFGSGRNARRLKPSSPVYPIGKHDSDKLERAICDALTGVVFADDGQVVDVVKSKRYAERRPGVAIVVIDGVVPAATVVDELAVFLRDIPIG